MKRKNRFCLALILLASLVLVSGVGLAKEYAEAPELAELVTRGVLPAVGERLPVNPLVAETESIGRYGGTLYLTYNGSADYENFYKIGVYRPLAEINQQFEYQPGVIDSWTWDEDRVVLTVELRRGVKWSDGHPLTAVDLVYSIEAKKDPSLPFITDRHIPYITTVRAVDDYTVEITHDRPQSDVSISGLMLQVFAHPKHYLEQFDPRYNPEMTVQDLDQAWSFERVSQALVDMPTLGAWVITEYVHNTRIVATRNPYYWKVDSEGNQLPYVDRLVFEYAADGTRLPLLAAQGRLSLQGRTVSVSDYEVYLANEERGGYKTVIAADGALGPSLKFNYAVDDLDLRSLFQNRDFRLALSYGTDRHEISERLYYGLVEPWGPIALRDTPLFPGEEYLKHYNSYDPVYANELLDGLGLFDTDGDGFREINGKPITIVLDVDSGGVGGATQTFEIVASQWEKIGIRLIVNTIERSLLVARWGENAQDAFMWRSESAMHPFYTPHHWYPNAHPSRYGNVGEPVALWFATDGKEGVEPPEFLKEYWVLMDEANTAVDTEEQNRLGIEAMKIAADNVLILSTTNLVSLVIVDERLANVPEEFMFTHTLGEIWMARPDQVYFKQ